MRRRRFPLAIVVGLGLGPLALAGGFVGCAGEGDPEAPASPGAPDGRLDEAAAPPDSGAGDGASPDADAKSCADCQFYPLQCASNGFCVVPVKVPSGARLTGMGGLSETDVWTSGVLGALLHYDGVAWTAVAQPVDSPFVKIWPRAAGEVWAAATLSEVFVGAPPLGDGGSGDGGWPNVRLTPRPTADTDAHVYGMWSAEGATWTWMAVTQKPFSEFASALNLKRVRKSGNSYFFQEPLECVDGCRALTAVHGVSKDEVWTVGEIGSAYRISNADKAPALLTLKAFDSRTFATLNGVWANGTADVWAVGTGGVIRHYTGAADDRFEIIASPVTTDLRAVWGSSGSDVWAVGDEAVVLHYDGKAWSRVPVGSLNGRPDLYAVWAASPTKAWAAGQNVLLELGAGADGGAR